MNTPIKIFFVFSAFLFSACCTNVSKEKPELSNTGNPLKSPASIAINKSIVNARIEEIFTGTNGNFIIKALITEVQEDPSYPSIALAGQTYNLIPNFQLDENKIKTDSEKNKKLNMLLNHSSGDEFKAVIFFENQIGWFIQEVL